MPFSTMAPINGIGLGPAGMSRPATKLLDDASRARLGLPPAAQVLAPKAKESLDGTTGGLGKDDFMKLLLVQMGNQDPLKPMEDKEFIAQLAQFNSLEQMQQVNKSISNLVAAQAVTQASGINGIVTGEVRAITISGGTPTLRVGSEEIGLADILRVLIPGEPVTVQETGDTTTTGGVMTSSGSTSPGG